MLFGGGESAVASSLLWLDGVRPLLGDIEDGVESINRHPELRDVRRFANPDPRPKPKLPTLPDEGEGYIGAFAKDHNWVQEWTVVGSEYPYDLPNMKDSP